MGRKLSHLLEILALSASLLMLCHAQAIQSPVDTSSGFVSGKSVPFRGKTLWEFKMIPYAEPPVGALRFKPPQPKSRESSIIDGSKDDFKICPQPESVTIEIAEVLLRLISNQPITVDEDCLYLDIYVPESASTQNLLPVFFWIHGGGYVSGFGRLSSGRVLASDYDVVVVTINYRLGVLGFLNTEDSNAVGDFGLRDQIFALRWVKENIRNFGGDPSKVTIAGESAGGGSVAQLSVAPSAEGLFQRGIIQSGGLDNLWVCVKHPRMIAMGLAVSAGCSTENTATMVECLRQKSLIELAKPQTGPLQQFVPACSGGVLPFTQSQLESTDITSDVAKRLAKLDIMIGNTIQEGATVFSQLSAHQIDRVHGISEEYALNFTAEMLASVGISPKHIKSLVPFTRYIYTDWKNPDNGKARMMKMTDFTSDTLFMISSIKLINLHRYIDVTDEERGQAYFFLLSPRPSWMSKQPWGYGADHSDDLFFMFGNPLEYPILNATEEEKAFSQAVMTYWTNFMKTGNPNSPMSTVNSQPLVNWPEYHLDNQQYIELDINMDSSSIGQRPLSTRMAFWMDYFPKELARLQSIKPPPPCRILNSATSTKATYTTLVLTTFMVLIMFLHK